jgi:ABC-type nitrate/sulfonate/bicarbonate transport system permease component
MVAGMLAVALLGFTVDKWVEAIQEWLARWRPSLQGISV